MCHLNLLSPDFVHEGVLMAETQWYMVYHTLALLSLERPD